MEKIKVIRIITRLNIGGPAINAVLLTNDLCQRFEVVLVTGQIGKDEGDMGYLAAEKGIRPIVIPQLQRNISIFKDISAFIKLVRLLRKEKPVIVHTHLAKAGIIGRLAALVAGVPIRIHTFHGHTFSNYFPSWQTKVFLSMERIIARYTDRIITISKKLSSEISDKYRVAPADKISIIPLGFELEKFLENTPGENSLRSRLNLEDGSLAVGIIGRLTPVKNHKLFLDVARDVLDRIDKVRFIIVGDGECRDALEKYAEDIGIKESVAFLGWQKNMQNVYQDLDIIALTSLNEGTPVSLIESMAAAKAVIATNVGGVPDVVKDGQTGILVESGDRETFTAKLIGLLIDREKRNFLGQNARSHVLERYSAGRLYRDIEKLYDEVIRQKARC